MKDSTVNKNLLNGVMCNVSECKYNKTGNKCAASSIKVDASNTASASGDTQCDTFITK